MQSMQALVVPRMPSTIADGDTVKLVGLDGANYSLNGLIGVVYFRMRTFADAVCNNSQLVCVTVEGTSYTVRRSNIVDTRVDPSALAATAAGRTPVLLLPTAATRDAETVFAVILALRQMWHPSAQAAAPTAEQVVEAMVLALKPFFAPEDTSLSEWGVAALERYAQARAAWGGEAGEIWAGEELHRLSGMVDGICPEKLKLEEIIEFYLAEQYLPDGDVARVREAWKEAMAKAAHIRDGAATLQSTATVAVEEVDSEAQGEATDLTTEVLGGVERRTQQLLDSAVQHMAQRSATRVHDFAALAISFLGILSEPAHWRAVARASHNNRTFARGQTRIDELLLGAHMALHSTSKGRLFLVHQQVANVVREAGLFVGNVARQSEASSIATRDRWGFSSTRDVPPLHAAHAARAAHAAHATTCYPCSPRRRGR